MCQKKKKIATKIISRQQSSQQEGVGSHRMLEESNSREVLLRKMYVASFITIHDISEELSL